MFNFYYYLSLYLILISFFMFSFYSKHLLLTIISLEFIVIGVVYNMFVIMMMLECNMILILYLLVFSVCEGALALSLMVMIVRLYGNDYLSTLTMLKW